jgi:hypothetical protein
MTETFPVSKLPRISDIMPMQHKQYYKNLNTAHTPVDVKS